MWTFLQAALSRLLFWNEHRELYQITDYKTQNSLSNEDAFFLSFVLILPHIFWRSEILFHTDVKLHNKYLNVHVNNKLDQTTNTSVRQGQNRVLQIVQDTVNTVVASAEPYADVC